MPSSYPRVEEVSAPEEFAGTAPLKGKFGAFAGTAGAILALDILTKYLVQQTLTPYDQILIIGDFFRLTFIYNPGAAFGLHLGPYSRFIFLTLAFVALAVLLVMYRHTAADDRLRLFAIGAISGGALGNVIDRIRSAEGVVDFLDFFWQGHHFPTFNVADSAICIGVGLYIISSYVVGPRMWHKHVPVAEP